MMNYDRRFVEMKLNKFKVKKHEENKPKRGYLILAAIAIILLFLI